MDINTPKGQIDAANQLLAIKTVLNNLPSNYQFAGTKIGGPANLDGVMVKDGTIMAVVEVKSRYDMDYIKFMTEFLGEWMISYDKIVNMQTACKMFDSDGYGFLYIVQSDLVLTNRICNSKGEIIVDVRVEERKTKKCTNGGEKVEDVALVDMHDSREYEVVKGGDST